jgi:hypothetical protein
LSALWTQVAHWSAPFWADTHAFEDISKHASQFNGDTNSHWHRGCCTPRSVSAARCSTSLGLGSSYQEFPAPARGHVSDASQRHRCTRSLVIRELFDRRRMPEAAIRTAGAGPAVCKFRGCQPRPQSHPRQPPPCPPSLQNAHHNSQSELAVATRADLCVIGGLADMHPRSAHRPALLHGTWHRH